MLRAGRLLRSRPLPVTAYRELHFTKLCRDGAKTPFQVFVNTFRKELRKSKELQTEIKALQDETGRLSESTAFKRAREALERSRDAGTATQRGIRKAGDAVGTAASATWNSAPVRLTRDAVSKTADAVDRAADPLRHTAVYKGLKDAVDDGSSIRYGGWESKEARHERRKRELERQRRLGNNQAPVKENEAAGDALVVSDVKPDTADRIRESGLAKKLGDLRIKFEESENGLVSAVRSVTDVVGGWFGETESAQVQRAFKVMDPSFSQEAFLRELRAYILPEVLDAYVRGDSSVLQAWLSEAAFNVWNQITKEYRDKGLYAAGRVLDVRGVDIIQGKMLQPSDIPVFIISARAQETNFYRSLKTDEIAAGIPDQILMSPYVMVITRVPENMQDPETRGWKILEFMRGRSTQYL